MPYLRSGPNVACPVTFGPGVPARVAPHVLPVPPSGADGNVRDEAPSGEPGADRNVGDQRGEAASESEAEAVVPELKLREQAVSLQHLLTHLPKNPYCKASVRAKARRSPAKRSRGPAPRRAHVTKYGDELSADHIMLGPSGDGRTVLVIRDLATGWIDAIPLPDKSADSTYQGFRRAFGRAAVGVVHSDNAPEFESALKDLGILPETGAPGRSNSNAVAERTAAWWRTARGRCWNRPECLCRFGCSRSGTSVCPTT